MILADKIVRLRKQLGWSQEELADKMDVSRQSVSKWESTSSIPDLNKIIKLAEIFEVSTDLLLKDEIEVCEALSEEKATSNVHQVNLEQALHYVDSKMNVAHVITKGVSLCVCSVVPLFFFLAMAQTNRLGITHDVATAIGILSVLIMVSVAVSFFLKTNHYERDIALIEKEPFELAYGVHSVFLDKLEKYRHTYNRRLSVGIFLFIISFMPLMLTSMFFNQEGMALIMLIVLLLFIAIGIHIVSPVSAKFEAYNNILKDRLMGHEKSKRTKRVEKLAAVYWPSLVAIFLGWSLWTMAWGITWILWPVGAVLFVALIGLIELFANDD